MKVIATIGLSGSGKDTVVEYISRKHSGHRITMSDITRKIAAEKKLESTWENLLQISQETMQKSGADYLPREVIKIIQENKWETVGISGARSLIDIKTFRECFGADFVLILLQVSDPKLRFQRIKNRSESRDPKNFEDFLEKDRREEENFKISEAVKEANHVINNDGSIETLYAKIDDLISEVLQLGTRKTN